MPTCLECGYSAPRLQWTHFKYKCTGKFKNGNEYMSAHPGSEIIDPELKKKYGFTLDSAVKKYGAVEGQKRWNEYCDAQATTNTFEYKHEKYGWTREQFDEYNSSRAVTIENMIKRHGEEIGVAKWQEYCERQGYTNTKEYFIEKYGAIIGVKKYIEVNKKKKNPHNPVSISEKLGITLDEAVDIILSRENSGRRYISNLEEEFTNMLEDKVGPLDYTSAKRPFGKWSHLLNTYVVYDIKHGNCIIEFNGDYWHANPNIYAGTATIRGVSAVDIWHQNMLKLQTAQDLEFKTLVVWETEFRNDKVGTINKVAEWILQEQP